MPHRPLDSWHRQTDVPLGDHREHPPGQFGKPYMKATVGVYAEGAVSDPELPTEAVGGDFGLDQPFVTF